MDTSISPKQLQDECKSAQPPIVIDVRREPAFLAAADMLTGALRRDPVNVETWADGRCFQSTSEDEAQSA